MESKKPISTKSFIRFTQCLSKVFEFIPSSSDCKLIVTARATAINRASMTASFLINDSVEGAVSALKALIKSESVDDGCIIREAELKGYSDVLKCLLTSLSCSPEDNKNKGSQDAK